jgi:hypothetical protein
LAVGLFLLFLFLFFLLIFVWVTLVTFVGMMLFLVC